MKLLHVLFQFLRHRLEGLSHLIEGLERLIESIFFEEFFDRRELLLCIF